MHEVVSISSSQASGHLLTQLYNVQELHIPYSKNAKLFHLNEVFLNVFRSNGKASYSPRAITCEYAGGYGYLGKFEHHEPQTNIDALNIPVKKVERVAKNEYQQKLDAGGQTDSSMLHTENTKYWTDYNKLIYRPSSLLELENYVHPGHHKHFQKLLFKDYHIGAAEYKESQDDVEDTFRKFLESLDMIQGVNFFSELDSAWGGFTNEMLIQLKDEYFNNGVSSKYNLWVYGITSPKENVLTRIKSFVEFSNNSTLFFPLDLQPQSSSLLQDTFNMESQWHRGAVESVFVNSLWGLNNQVESPIRMAEIEDNVLRGYNKRNVVNEIKIHAEKEPASEEALMQMYYGNLETTVPKNAYIDLGFTNTDDKTFGRLYVTMDNAELDGTVYQNKFMDEITKLETFPKIMEGKFYTEFGQTKALRDTLKGYRKIIERVRLATHLEIIGEKAELVEDLSNLIEEYTTGYEDDSEEYD